MTIHSQATFAQQPQPAIAEASAVGDVVGLDQEQLYRASTYALIAALLRDAPDRNMLEYIVQLIQPHEENSDDLLMAMSTLGLSARMLTPEAIDDEYHALFIGLGKGQVVPYASWYVTGFLMEKPLSDLRDDLERLGFARDPSTLEPEDHIAALYEVMSMLISEGAALSVQKHFFQAHMASWIDRFYADLMSAKAAVFYKSLGRFGSAFSCLEKDYFSMQT